MSAVLQATAAEYRPLDLTLPTQDNQTDAEWAEVEKHTLAYAGPFYFNDSQTKDDSQGQIVHGPLLTTLYRLLSGHCSIVISCSPKMESSLT